MMKKTIALSIALLMMLSLLVSCKKQDNSDDTVSTDGGSTEQLALHSLPRQDFEQKEFTVFTRDEFKYEFSNEGDTSSPIGEFVFNRNTALESYYNVKINVLSAPGLWANRSSYKEKISNAVLGGGVSEYDIICGAQNQISACVTDGYFLNLRDNPKLNFESKWYFKGFVDNMTVNNRLYFVVGDAAPSLLENMNVVAFNKDICLSHDIDMPYDLVRQNNWTLETMDIMADKFPYVDTNENNNTDQDDLYSIVGGGAMLRALSTSFDMKIVTMDAMGYPEITLRSERNIDIFDQFQAFLYDGNAGNFKDDFDPEKSFGSQKSLLQFTSLAGIMNLRKTYDVNYGIVPFPKYDSAQENYYTHIYETLTVFTIPKNAESAENSAVILEGLGAASYDYITPNYFETVLRMQNSQDTDSLEMIQMARDNISFNFGFVNGKAIGDIGAIFDGMKNGNYNLENSWNIRGGSWKKALGTLIEGYIGIEF